MKNLKMKFLCIILLLLAKTAIAQAPDWAVNRSDFQYTMTTTAFLNLEGRTLSSEQDVVAAFVEDEPRGNANLIYVEGVDRYLAYLTIYANKESDLIEFKIYDSNTGSIVTVESTINFVIDGQIGNVFQAFSIARPILNNEASIKNFYFTNIDTISSDISEGFVDIEVRYGQEITALIPEFIVSDGAKMFMDKTIQVSGDTALDFTFPHFYSVLSEDESKMSTYQIKVNNQQTDNEAGFYSSNVITANNDGDNDYWVVENASNYSDYEFKILDVNGRVLYESLGYRNDWDGHYKGNKLAQGKYYFQIENKERNSLITGNILLMY